MNHEDTAYKLTQQGHEFRKKQDWQHAIECYKRAADIEPNGEAQGALAMLQDILLHWNRGMYDV